MCCYVFTIWAFSRGSVQSALPRLNFLYISCSDDILFGNLESIHSALITKTNCGCIRWSMRVLCKLQGKVLVNSLMTCSLCKNVRVVSYVAVQTRALCMPAFFFVASSLDVPQGVTS